MLYECFILRISLYVSNICTRCFYFTQQKKQKKPGGSHICAPLEFHDAAAQARSRQHVYNGNVAAEKHARHCQSAVVCVCSFVRRPIVENRHSRFACEFVAPVRKIYVFTCKRIYIPRRIVHGKSNTQQLALSLSWSRFVNLGLCFAFPPERHFRANNQSQENLVVVLKVAKLCVRDKMWSLSSSLCWNHRNISCMHALSIVASICLYN